MRQPEDLADVRASYDRVADAYVEMEVGLLDQHPWLRAALAAFAEHVAPLGPVLDVGCGPGSVTAHLGGWAWTCAEWTCHRGWSSTPVA